MVRQPLGETVEPNHPPPGQAAGNSCALLVALAVVAPRLRSMIALCFRPRSKASGRKKHTRLKLLYPEGVVFHSPALSRSDNAGLWNTTPSGLMDSGLPASGRFPSAARLTAFPATMSGAHRAGRWLVPFWLATVYNDPSAVQARSLFGVIVAVTPNAVRLTPQSPHPAHRAFPPACRAPRCRRRSAGTAG